MKFSILLPTYKSKFLGECVESILSQTYKDFELIIVNDASPDDIASIVKSFDDSRIHYYVNEKNCGAVNVVDNWNKCLSYAKGDYVICMGDDDKLLPNCLEEYAKLIEKHPGLDVYHGLTEIINEEGETVRMQGSRPEYESVWAMIYRRWNGCEQFIGDFLFATSALLDNGGFYKLPLAWGSDDVTAYRGALTKGTVNTQVPVFQYRVNSQTISKTNRSKQLYVARREGVLGQLAWFERFLEIRPQNEIDDKYWRLLKQDYAPYRISRLEECVKIELASTFFKAMFYWMKNRKHYGLAIKHIAFCVASVVAHKPYRFLKNR